VTRIRLLALALFIGVSSAVLIGCGKSSDTGGANKVSSEEAAEKMKKQQEEMRNKMKQGGFKGPPKSQ